MFRVTKKILVWCTICVCCQFYFSKTLKSRLSSELDGVVSVFVLLLLASDFFRNNLMIVITNCFYSIPDGINCQKIFAGTSGVFS